MAAGVTERSNPPPPWYIHKGLRPERTMVRKLYQEQMNSREFFYLVAEMREAQKAYFETRDRRVFLAARALENDVDREIRRVRTIVNQTEPKPSV